MTGRIDYGSIMGIIKLLNIMWNYEPELDPTLPKSGQRGSRLPAEINQMFWIICDRIVDEEHFLMDISEKDMHTRWANHIDW